MKRLSGLAKLGEQATGAKIEALAADLATVDWTQVDTEIADVARRAANSSDDYLESVRSLAQSDQSSITDRLTQRVAAVEAYWPANEETT